MTKVVRQLRQVAGVRSVKAGDFRKGEFELVGGEGRAISTAALRQAVQRSGLTINRIVTPRPSSESSRNTSLPPSLSAEEKQLLAVPKNDFLNRQYQAALEAAQKAAERSPTSSEIHQFLALCYFAAGRYEGARDVARRALQLGQPWNWNQLKSHYVASKEYAGQLRDFERYLTEGGKGDEFGLLLGYHYWMLGHLETAEREFLKAADHAPEDELFPKLLEQLHKTAESNAETKGSQLTSP